jgi:hypothetical protein
MEMNSYTAYVTTLAKVYQENPEVFHLSPAELLDGWEGFVGQVEDGYQYDVSEYDHDIVIRDQLEHLVSYSGIQKFQEFLCMVEKVDDRFRSLCCLVSSARLPRLDGGPEEY